MSHEKESRLSFAVGTSIKVRRTAQIEIGKLSSCSRYPVLLPAILLGNQCVRLIRSNPQHSRMQAMYIPSQRTNSSSLNPERDFDNSNRTTTRLICTSYPTPHPAKPRTRKLPQTPRAPTRTVLRHAAPAPSPAELQLPICSEYRAFAVLASETRRPSFRAKENTRSIKLPAAKQTQVV